MKQISITVGKDGRLEGWENGRFRYLGDSNSIDIGWINSRSHIRVSNFSSTNITYRLNDRTIHIGYSITCTEIPESFRALMVTKLGFVGTFTRRYWRDILNIGEFIFGLLGTLRTFGILMHRFK